jgi:hypothetical protein
MDRIRTQLSEIFVLRRVDRYALLGSHADSGEQIEDVSDQEIHEKSPDENSYQTKPWFSPILMSSALLAVLLGFALCTGLLIAIVVISTTKTHEIKPQTMISPCGSSPQEARSRQCHFDVISFCWLPDECYDAELSREFDKSNNLEWFLDANRTQPVSHQDIMTGEYTGLYVNWEYHLRHCTAMWKKLHRTIAGGSGAQAIDAYIGSFKHTEHCEKMLLGDRGIAFDIINTRIAVKYPDCGVVSSD